MNSTTEEFAHESEKSTKITSSEWDVGELRGSHAGCVRIKRLVSVIISHGRACRRHIWGIANLWWPLLWWPPEDGGGPCVAKHKFSCVIQHYAVSRNKGFLFIPGLHSCSIRVGGDTDPAAVGSPQGE